MATDTSGFAPPIEDYALIGDCRSAALVSRDGSIDWLCWPRFDSPACFAALLGRAEHGRWRIGPQQAAVSISRRYRPDTLILETVFETETGSVALIDFMAMHGGDASKPPAVIRIVEGRRGSVAMRLDLALRFDYGAAIPWVTRLEFRPSPAPTWLCCVPRSNCAGSLSPPSPISPSPPASACPSPSATVPRNCRHRPDRMPRRLCATLRRIGPNGPRAAPIAGRGVRRCSVR
jgi:hypothetical protein